MKDMNDFKFELNSEGVKDLLRSDEMTGALNELALKVRNSAGDGYEISEYIGKNRANVSVRAETKKAKRDNLKNNTLLKALGSLKG